MNITLERPLAFFDLETTGVNVATDRIVEISILRIQPNGDKDSYTRKVNPTIPIPIEASEIHGIYDFDVKDCPTFRDLAPEVVAFIAGCDLGGYNSNKFDVPLLAEELLRAEQNIDLQERKMVDVQVIFHKMEKRTLEAAYKFYCGKELENAHSAEADIHATFEVLEAQLDRYDELEGNMDFLSEYSTHNRSVDFAGRLVYNDKDEPCFNFGKYKGQTVDEVLRKDSGYFGWIMQAEFPLYTKKVLTDIKDAMQ